MRNKDFSIILAILFFIIARCASAQITCKPSVTHVTCNGNSNGSILLSNVTGGTAPYTYTWQPGSINSSSITSKPIGSYSVTIKGTGTVTATYVCNIGYKTRWQNMYNTMTQSGDTLKHGSGSSSWLYSANTSNILSGSADGWVEYVVTGTSQPKLFGLVDSASAAGWYYIDFGIMLNSGGTYNTCNNGSQSSIGTYTIGDVLKIERVGSNINYKKNNVTVWTTTITTQMTQSRLTVRAAVYSTGSSLENLGCSFPSVNAALSSSTATITCLVPAVELTALTNVAAPNYSWNPGGSAPTSSISSFLDGGTCTLKITEPYYGCFATATATIYANRCKANVTHVSCVGNTNGSISLSNVTGGTSPYTYTWQPGSTSSSSITSKGIGSYSVTIKGTGTVTATNAYNIGYKVRWQNMYTGMSQSNDTLKHGPGSSSWLYSARSSNVLNKSTDGWVEYVVASMDHRIFGLADSGSVVGWNAIDFGMILNANGTYTTRNNNDAVFYLGSYAIGDVMRIERSGGNINYKKNGTSVWTSSITTQMQQSKMFIGAAVYETGKTLGNLGCSFQSVDVSAVVTGSISCSVSSVNIIAYTAVASANYSWRPGGSTPTASNTAVSSAGTYSVKVTEPFYGCFLTTTLSVSSNTIAPTLTITNSPTITCGSPTVVVTSTTSSSGVTYSWSPGGATTSSLTVSTPGTYTLKATNSSNGCSVSRTVSVISNTAIPTLTITNSPTITCSSPTVIITSTTSTSGVTYSWTPGGITTSTLGVAVAGTYTLKVTNPANGCSSTATVAVTSNTALPNVSIVAPTPTITCATPTAVLTGSSTTSGVTYSWSPGGITTSTLGVTVAGTYTLKVTNPVNGCTSMVTAAVTSNTTLPNISIVAPTPTITCSTPTAVLTGSSTSSGVTYSWSPGGITTSTLGVTVAGTYTLKVTDPVNGCSSTTTVAVTANTILPDISIVPYQIITTGTSSVTLSGSSNTSGVTYSWSPGGSTPTSSATVVSSIGVHTLMVTNTTNSCVSTATVLVVNQLSATATITDYESESVKGKVVLNIMGGVTPYKVFWNGMKIPLPAVAYKLLKDSLPTIIIDSVAFTHHIDSLRQRTIYDNLNPGINLFEIYDQTDVSVIITASVDSKIHSWVASTGVNTSTNSINNFSVGNINFYYGTGMAITQTGTFAPGGSYSIPATNMNLSDTNEMSFVIPDNTDVAYVGILENNMELNGDTTEMYQRTLFRFNGDGTYNIIFNNQSIFSGTFSSGDHFSLSTNTTAGKISYFKNELPLTESDISLINFGFEFTPKIILGSSGAIVSGLKIKYPFQIIPIFLPPFNKCLLQTLFYSINVSASPNPVCSGSTTNLTGSLIDVLSSSSVSVPSGNYFWKPVNLTGPGPIPVGPATTQIYTLEVTYAPGCVLKGSLLVTVKGLAANAGADAFVLSGTNVVLGGNPSAYAGSGNYSYAWTPSASYVPNSNDANPTINATSNQVYTLTVMDNTNSCVKIDDKLVYLINEPYYFVLKKVLDAEYYNSYNNKIYFTFEEEYFDSSASLNYKIVDDKNVEITSLTSQTEHVGDNRFQLNISSLTTGAFYRISITNKKNEVFYARFKY